MEIFAHSLNFILMLALPVALGFILARRLRVGWQVWGVGVVTFIASQVVHLPLIFGLTKLFQNGVLPAPPEAWTTAFNAVVLGLAAGVCEETARYLVYRFWITRARTWREALMFGAGHGGIEAIIFGGLVGLTFINMVVLRDTAVTSLPVSADQQVLAAQQIAAYWATPWTEALLGAVERLFAMCFHLSAAVLVLQAIKRRNLLWLGAAILWHSTLDALAVMVLAAWGVYWAEAAVGGLALVNLAIIFLLRPTIDDAPPAEPVATLPSTATPVAEDSESQLKRQLDESRFN